MSVQDAGCDPIAVGSEQTGELTGFPGNTGQSLDVFVAAGGPLMPDRPSPHGGAEIVGG